MGTRILPDGPNGRAEAIRALEAGGLVGFPTDTVYGIAVASSAVDGLARLFAAKQRPPDRAIVLLLADSDQASTLGVLGPAGEALARAFWPGGLTLVMARRDASGSIGLRVPDHPTPQALARAVGPLPTTSANLSGEPEAASAIEVAEQLGEELDLILDGGPARGNRASTVVDVSGVGVRILRAGAIEVDEIARALVVAGLPEPVGR
jgi:L-threonylcarbamoyladenylate synthase